jgi:hypothetical protein
MHSRSSSRVLIASFLFTLSLTPSLHALPATTHPTIPRSNPRSECRCVTISDPGASSLLLLEASRSRQWHCAELGPKLEYWRKANPDEFDSTWRDLFLDDGEYDSLASKTASHQPGPLPTSVLMEMAKRPQGEIGSPGERIICRARKESSNQPHEPGDDWTDNGLVIMTIFIVLVVLGCVAELLDMLFCR